MGAIHRRNNIEANYIRGTSGNAPATLVNLPTRGERIDSDPAWSPDSKTLAVFSSAGEEEQRQLWIVNADGSDPKNLRILTDMLRVLVGRMMGNRSPSSI